LTWVRPCVVWWGSSSAARSVRRSAAISGRCKSGWAHLTGPRSPSASGSSATPLRSTRS
jgi:hypothetical protein